MVISESPLALITFSDMNKVLSIQWKAKPDMELFKKTYWEVLQFVKGNGKICYYSTDISLIGPLDPEQEAWLSREYYAQVYASIQADIYAAVIFSEGHFNALVHNYVPSQQLPLSDFIYFNYFTNAEEAADWLVFIQKGQDLTLYAKS
jgi:hypothetical protein